MKQSKAAAGEQRRRARGKRRGIAGYVPVVPIAAALEQPPGDLRMEIAAVRAVLAELLEAELPAETLANVVDRATNALVRLMRANKSLAEKQDEADQAALDVLRDLGQGER